VTKHHGAVPRGLVAGTSGLPIVAIVGRPNVGKSTLFNRLARRRLAIVHDEPGVTRDRHYADTMSQGRRYTLIDTGGFDPDDDDPMKAGIVRHVRAAIEEADVIVFVTDATIPPTSADRAAVDLLRRAKKPAFFAANKADGPHQDAEASDLYRLGVKKVYAVSALHGRGVGELEMDIIAALPPAEETAVEDESVVRVSIVGRPNAGKSSLVNRILGEDRMLVDDRPGTTRDAIDALVETDHGKFIIVDTAGIRRKAKVTKAGDEVESLGVWSAILSIERSQVVVLLCDAKDGVSEQDAKILGLAEERGRAVVIALNKSDLLSREEIGKAETKAREKLSFAQWAPVVLVSAKTGRGVNELLETVRKSKASFTQRIGTGELNRFFEQVLESRSPPTQGGKAPRLYYITQAETAPPLFVVVASQPEAVHFSYRRFVANQLRKRFGFEGTPIRVTYRSKRRRETPAFVAARAPVKRRREH
jgi:GTP-binding protein